MPATTERGHIDGGAGRIIDLAELRGQDAFPAFVAVYCAEPGNPYGLSADVMCWSRHVYLSRLEECRRFWLTQKKKLRCKLSELFDPVLRQQYGEAYLAVFGDHPWQCLVYLHYRLAQGASGPYFLQSPIDRNIFKSLDWHCWFAPQAELARHLEAIGARGFRADRFRRRQAQLRRFIERIGVASPCEMSAAGPNAMQRRFGTWLARAWRWTFSRSSALEYFPWIRLRARPNPAVGRDLEYPVNQWAYVELLLREDLERLCDQFRRDDCEHVNRMTWRITLFNYRKLDVDLSFRHPYSLHRDRPGFDTALYQARYVYDDLMRRLAERERDLDLPEQMPFVGWRIEVCERIALSPMLWDWFAAGDDAIDYRKILELQNKLPAAFESYRAEASFLPERSFAGCLPGRAPAPAFDDLCWTSSAGNKPLFYYRQPQPIDTPGPARLQFLERNASPWWHGRDALQSIRDYFLLQDGRGRRSWAFRTRDGAWFKQGEFN